MISFAGDVAIVTGGASGIGRACATLLHNLGAHVAVVDRDRARGSALTRRLAADRPGTKFFEADCGDEDSIHACSERIVRDVGRATILVNCAAVYVMEGAGASQKTWQKSFTVNAVGYALWINRFVEAIPNGSSGAIVNVSSISAHIAQPGFATYSAAKGAVSAMTRCFALDLAPRIRVNAVAPGTIWSESNARFVKENFGLDRDGADAHLNIGGRSVLKRCGDPEEVAQAIAFLCSSAASFITGTELLVDGGYMLQ